MSSAKVSSANVVAVAVSNLTTLASYNSLPGREKIFIFVKE